MVVFTQEISNFPDSFGSDVIELIKRIVNPKQNEEIVYIPTEGFCNPKRFCGKVGICVNDIEEIFLLVVRNGDQIDVNGVDSLAEYHGKIFVIVWSISNQPKVYPGVKWNKIVSKANSISQRCIAALEE